MTYKLTQLFGTILWKKTKNSIIKYIKKKSKENNNKKQKWHDYYSKACHIPFNYFFVKDNTVIYLLFKKLICQVLFNRLGL